MKLGSLTIAEMRLPNILPDVIPEEKDPSGYPGEPDDYYEEEYEEYSSSIIAHSLVDNIFKIPNCILRHH